MTDIDSLLATAKSFREATEGQKLPSEGSIIGLWMATASALESTTARLREAEAKEREAWKVANERLDAYTDTARKLRETTARLRGADARANRGAEIVTLCGSTKFKDAIHAENMRLTMEGKIVISLGVFGHTDLPDYDWTTDASDLKRMLDELHLRKIDMADYVYVVNPGGYIGDSTRHEIEYTLRNGKPVQYLDAPDREDGSNQ